MPDITSGFFVPINITYNNYMLVDSSSPTLNSFNAFLKKYGVSSSNIFDVKIDAIVLKYGRTVAYIRTKLKAGSTLDDIIAHYERLANK